MSEADGRYIVEATMIKGVSDDIKAVIGWELAHGNAISSNPPREVNGELIVFMVRHVRSTEGAAPRQLPPTLRPWEFRDPHYAGHEWLAGFRSVDSGQVICGPLERHGQAVAG